MDRVFSAISQYMRLMIKLSMATITILRLKPTHIGIVTMRH